MAIIIIIILGASLLFRINQKPKEKNANDSTISIPLANIKKSYVGTNAIKSYSGEYLIIFGNNSEHLRFELTTKTFIQLSDAGYFVNLFCDFPDSVVVDILNNYPQYIKKYHIRGMRTYKEDYWDRFYGKLPNRMHKLIGSKKEYFNSIDKDALLEYISVLPLASPEDFKTALSLISKDDYPDLIKRLSDYMKFISKVYSRHYAFEKKKIVAVRFFDQIFVVKTLMSLGRLWRFNPWDCRELFSDEFLNAIIEVAPEEIHKYGSKLPLSDQQILAVARKSLGYCGPLILDKITPDTGRELLKMSKSALTINLLPREIKGIVSEIITQDPNRLKDIRDAQLKSDIVKWVS